MTGSAERPRQPRRLEFAGSAVAHANRAAGQAAGVAEMVRAGKSLPAIVQQLLAAHGSLDALLLRLVQQEVDRQVLAENIHPDARQLLGPVLRRSRSPSSHSRTPHTLSSPPPTAHTQE